MIGAASLGFGGRLDLEIPGLGLSFRPRNGAGVEFHGGRLVADVGLHLFIFYKDHSFIKSMCC